MSRVPQEFIKNLQGKDFVLFSGLLELAHQDGLSQTVTDIIQFPNQANGMTTIVKASVTTKKGTFSGIGDASPTSVPNKAIAVHSIRMAETRAVARALRVATNVGMTALEELGGDEGLAHAPVNTSDLVAKTPEKQFKQSIQEPSKNLGKCRDCGQQIRWVTSSKGKPVGVEPDTWAEGEDKWLEHHTPHYKVCPAKKEA
jgi:hypothetical protein